MMGSETGIGYDMGWGMGWGMGFGGVGMVLVLALILLSIFALVKYLRN